MEIWLTTTIWKSLSSNSPFTNGFLRERPWLQLRFRGKRITKAFLGERLWLQIRFCIEVWLQIGLPGARVTKAFLGERLWLQLDFCESDVGSNLGSWEDR